MKAIVVYESMYGNTHLIADAVAAGMADLGEVVVVPVGGATPDTLADADLVVVGGPTHVHGMSSAMSRKGAVEDAAKPEKGLELDPDAEGPGLRDWFDEVGTLPAMAAAFDTRMPGPPALTGRACKGIAKRLHHHGCRMVAEPMSFLVTKDNHLADDEDAHARQWGADLAARCAPVAPE
ncbi:MAG: flavodoxin domain-containing protein [Acidimicrobiia bacterium]|jgi:hypothetical protein